MNPKLAIKLLLRLIGAVILFHLAILLKIIPYKVTWGGRLENDIEMFVFEMMSVLINLFLAVLLLIKGKDLSCFIPMKVVNIILWVFLFLFGINTVGNIVAKTLFEKSLSLLTLIFTYLIWIILKGTEKTHNKT
ncbi:hypothetical protein OAG16_02295 [Saprospiraceae bacterium]|nr:hypothetical protein [bacterium]MDB4768885.1 hypothetical protein [Saprospiraceae bacterium]MDG1434818.1 hypothetical protein [Saprospiraceae bacterium]